MKYTPIPCLSGRLRAASHLPAAQRLELCMLHKAMCVDCLKKSATSNLHNLLTHPSPSPQELRKCVLMTSACWPGPSPAVLTPWLIRYQGQDIRPDVARSPERCLGWFYAKTEGERSALQEVIQVRQTQREILTATVPSRSSGGQGPSHPDEPLACAQSLIAWLAGLLLAKRIQ